MQDQYCSDFDFIIVFEGLFRVATFARYIYTFAFDKELNHSFYNVVLEVSIGDQIC